MREIDVPMMKINTKPFKKIDKPKRTATPFSARSADDPNQKTD